MEVLPTQMQAEMALVRQNAALSMIKSTAKADQAIIGILEDSARNIASSNRGANVNISA